MNIGNVHSKLSLAILLPFYLTLLNLAGCTYFKPAILPKTTDYCDEKFDSSQRDGTVGDNRSPNHNGVACHDLPRVKEAVKMINGDAETASGKITSNNYVGRALDVATFALGGAFAIKASHGSTISNGARNLAFGAGATYVGRSLFASSSQSASYGSAMFTLECIAETGNQLLGTYDQASIQIDEAQKLANCSDSGGALTDQRKILAASLGTAYSTSEKMAASDGAIQHIMIKAYRTTLQSLQNQLDASSPKSAEMLVAGSDMTTISNGLIQKPWKGTLTKTVCETSPTASSLQNTAVAVDGVTQSLALELNGFQAAVNMCITGSPPQAAPFVVTPTSVVLMPGSTEVVLITGGTGKYSSDWVGTAPDIKYVSQSIQQGAASFIKISEFKGDGIDGSYTLNVTDSSTVPQSVKVQIQTNKRSSHVQ